MADTLAAEDVTSLVVVATPEELPLTEAAEVMGAADEAGLTPVRMLVLNRVLQSAGFDDLPVEMGPTRDAAALQLEVEAAQAPHLAAAGAAHRLPLLLGTHRPVDVSRTLADRLESP